ncbi:hypothetical protein H2198_009967 [Neophaeococcomyces mojaviensis]|uniref:Uncharacterized protein n=1 Tax=Neophaeococcomyces mojaviensis TaxID=3383035 RepID=A0ACC2ZSZ7_9EURO|nr:hypothetical protein H2198_009967 [Knufia sp. JES_112]
MTSTNSAKSGPPGASPSVSYWQQPPDPIADLRSSSDLPQDVDLVIVGSGISGSSIAHHLLNEKPELKIVMLEARQAASGASGRNGGHTKTATYRSFLENVQEVGEEDAVKVSKLEYDCMVAVHDFIKQQGMDCDAKQCDTVDIFYDQGHLDEAKIAVAKMEKLIGPSHPCSHHTFYTPEETRKNFFCEDSLGSIKYDAGSLSAYKLTVGILKLALEKGLNLQTTTPATSITKQASEHGKSTWTVSTPRGEIRTPTLVLATNGYTAHLYPKLQDVIVPFRGVVTAQRPGSSVAHQGDLPTTYSFVYKEGYEYMITRPAIDLPSTTTPATNGTSTFTTTANLSPNTYDIVIGGGLTKTANQGSGEFHTIDDTSSSIPSSIIDYLNTTPADFFGAANWGTDHALGRIKHVWSGIMGYSADGHPLVGPMPGEEGLWIDASFQGHGMVLCWLCAKAFVEMLLGRDGTELKTWFPDCFRVTEERLGKRFSGRLVGREIGEAQTVNGFDGN